MFKAIMASCLALAASLAVHAETTSRISMAKNLSFLTSGDQSQTPYQKLEALFNSAKPMQLSQFPTPQSPDLNKWQCSYVIRKDTTAETVGGVDTSVPALLTGTIVISPAVPSSGPLFPATPEKDKTVLAIINIPTDGTFNWDAKQIGGYYSSQKVNLVPYPEVVEKALLDANQQNSWVSVTYRTIDDLIVIKQVVTDVNDYGNDQGYSYCWKQQ